MEWIFKKSECPKCKHKLTILDLNKNGVCPKCGTAIIKSKENKNETNARIDG
jgi:predicted RNA-binding Zn-ribbon protein involved in translation (DUF1610 family)